MNTGTQNIAPVNLERVLHPTAVLHFPCIGDVVLRRFRTLPAPVPVSTPKPPLCAHTMTIRVITDTLTYYLYTNT